MNSHCSAQLFGITKNGEQGCYNVYVNDGSVTMKLRNVVKSTHDVTTIGNYWHEYVLIFYNIMMDKQNAGR